MLRRVHARTCVAGLAALAALAAGSGALRSALAATAAPVGHAQIGQWGLDLSARDPTVRPGDDFFRYANGHWLDTSSIPADRSRWGMFDELQERSLQQLRGILEALPQDATAGSNARKLVDFYRAYLDTDAIDRAGLAPARTGLATIAAARSHEDLARLMSRPDARTLSPLEFRTIADERDPDHYMVTIGQSGLGLPDRDYYLKDEPVYQGLRGKYAAHIERVLKLA